MVPRSPATAKRSLAQGTEGLGRTVVPQQGVTCVSGCEVVLAPDQGAKGAELLPSGRSRASPFPWAFLFQSVT